MTATTSNEAIAAGVAAGLAANAAAMPAASSPNAPNSTGPSPLALGAGQTLARKLVGDASRYAHMTRGRGKGAAQVLDLDPLREALGASWSSYGELIHGIALRIMHRHLGGAYEHERYAERYLVFFQELSEREARERMTRIASALAEFLFGSGANLAEPARRFGGPRGKRTTRGAFSGIGDAFGRLMRTVGTLVAVKERAGLTDETKPAGKTRNVTLRGGAMDLAAPPERPATTATATVGPNATLRGAAPITTATEATGTKTSTLAEPNWTASPRSAKPATRRGVFNASAQRGESPLGKTAPTKPGEKAASPDGAATGNAEDAALKELARRAKVPMANRDSDGIELPKAAAATASPASAPVAKPAKPTELAVDKLSFVYRPMWSVRTNMLAISGCCAAGKLANGELGIGEAVLPPAATLEVIEKLDRAALAHVLEHCLPGMESGRGTIIALPVHYETLYDRERRSNYLNLCRTLPASARKRLIFECRNIDDTSDQAALISTLQQLKPYATMLIGTLPLRTSNFALWKRAGLGSVGVDIAAEPGSESEIIADMHQFATQASQNGLRATACNLGTLSLAAAAMQAGFDFIEGGVIQNQLRPMDVRPFTLEDLYLQYAVARRAKVGPGRLLDATPDGTPAA
jgi:EAL domain-containing protein (putative c-di-GMP-specific phosphodiesterase class I)